MNEKTNGSYELRPIGRVREGEEGSVLEIQAPFRGALAQLDQFGHVIVVWWAHHHDNEEARNVTRCELPYAPGTRAGIFACRAEYRPNPIALTVCPVAEVDEERGLVRVPWIDAVDGTPVLDLKGYFPVCDRVRDVKVPEWAAEWPEWVEDAHLLDF
jgi:tRNA-Thr(GGU) m(6)t(6)A37 methyltransferase TsaA